VRGSSINSYTRPSAFLTTDKYSTSEDVVNDPSLRHFDTIQPHDRQTQTDMLTTAITSLCKADKLQK